RNARAAVAPPVRGAYQGRNHAPATRREEGRQRMTIPQQIKMARQVSTPLISVITADPPATVARTLRAFNGKAPAVMQHDIISGLVGLNDDGNAAIAALLAGDSGPELPGTVP